jgi:hypothetical protein
MADQVRQHEFRAAVTAFLAEREGRSRYARAQREATNGSRTGASTARPLEFDERGFPIPQVPPRFITRVARLLNPF